MMETPTFDPDIVIEDQRPSYILYRRLSDGARWEVRGECDQRGDCLIGVVIDVPGQGEVQIRDHAHIEELKSQLGVDRLVSELDVPVAPGFSNCCPLTITPL